MCQKVSELQDNGRVTSSASLKKTKKFVVSTQMCLAINNIDHLLAFIEPFVDELGIEDTLNQLENLSGPTVAEACRRTLMTLVKNAVENVENKIFEVKKVLFFV